MNRAADVARPRRGLDVSEKRPGEVTDGATGMVRIRPVVAADTDAILALWARVFPEYFDPAFPQRDPRASIERKLAFGDGRFWVAVAGAGAGEQVVGTVMSGYDGHRGWLYSLGVDPVRRRSAIASALAAHAEAELARGPGGDLADAHGRLGVPGDGVYAKLEGIAFQLLDEFG